MIEGKPITVTGATGRLGRAVVDCLLARGVAVRALSRNPPADDRPGLAWLLCDLSVGTGLGEACAGTGAVIHCATNPRSPKQDVAGTRKLIGALAAEHTPLTYISIVGVDRIPSGYYRIKQEVEDMIQASGLPWAILRATQFHDLVAGALRVLAFSPVMPLPADTSVQPVDVGEVAGRLIDLAHTPGVGRASDFGGPEVRAIGEFARIWLRHTSKRRRIVPVRLPGRTAAGFREGHHLTPDHRNGGRTFSEYLDRDP